MSYKPQLDGLRACAVLAVLFFHFYEGGTRGSLRFGYLGVLLFFVLSGFLITSILLDCRERSEGPKRSQQLRRFYCRRALRILPVFYLVLLLGAAANVEGVREAFLWHFSYLSNVYFALIGRWNGPASAFWTLAVEEQFYLIWPWLILFLPRRAILPAIIGAIALSVSYRALGVFMGWNPFVDYLTIGNMDALGLGALLAWAKQMQPGSFARIGASRGYNIAGGATLFSLLLLSIAPPNGELRRISEGLVASVFCAWVVHKGSIGFGGWPGRILSSRVMIGCGMISYAMYAFHLFVPLVVADAARRLHVALPGDRLTQFVIFTGVTTLAAAASWVLLEGPINRLKRHFPYEL